MSTARATSTGPVPRHALRRGTRGFVAVVLFLTGLIVLAVAAFVLPTTPLDRLALSWLIPLTIVFGIAHLVAVYGAIRRRAWTVSLTLYLLAIGGGAAAYGLILSMTGAEVVAPASGPGDVTGLLVWLIGSWLVAARFVVLGFAQPVGRTINAGVAETAFPAGSVVGSAPVPAPDLRRRTMLESGRSSAA